jgi:hypothetical protein
VSAVPLFSPNRVLQRLLPQGRGRLLHAIEIGIGSQPGGVCPSFIQRQVQIDEGLDAITVQGIKRRGFVRVECVRLPQRKGLLVIGQPLHVVFLQVAKASLGNQHLVGSRVLAKTGKAAYCQQADQPTPALFWFAHDLGIGSNAYELEYYFYKDNRVTFIKQTTLFAGDDGFFLKSTDTVRYDKFGNPMSYGFNTYTYDYTKKGGQKFYADIFMGVESDFYLLQYLGFFPEINNPPNIRTSEANSDAAEGAPSRIKRSTHKVCSRVLDLMANNARLPGIVRGKWCTLVADRRGNVVEGQIEFVLPFEVGSVGEAINATAMESAVCCGSASRRPRK